MQMVVAPVSDLLSGQRNPFQACGMVTHQIKAALLTSGNRRVPQMFMTMAPRSESQSRVDKERSGGRVYALKVIAV